MAALRVPRNCHFWNCLLFLLLNHASSVFCYQYKVGDLASWNVPSSSNPDVYIKWSKNQTFKIGDSLFFLYPPSQDSVIQVTKESYRTCNLKDPILYLNNGNSLFNITAPGNIFFISGAKGHCQNSQKLQVFVAGGNGSAGYDDGADIPIASAPAAAAAGPSSNDFGSIPSQHSSSPSLKTPISAVSAAILALIVSSCI
ncbi:PREDICTED: stellacyanin-like [Ipomoea nil]|uniref:stellacyanin-like n=1 Tax=Ipomoea nil TaxID=35883 RepID=UPI0009016D4A|nr:PREDICTED: stellacyanin-like [Ipomoea nil]